MGFAKTNMKKIAIGVGVFTALAVVGVVTGVVVSQKNKNHNNNSNGTTNGPSHTGGSGNSPTPTSSGATSTPSSFPLNPALFKSFYGIAYTPAGAIMPECGANLPAVVKDVQLLSQLTGRLRLYGSDCNVTSLVLQAIQDTGVDLKVYPGIFLEAEDESYTRQKTILQNALQTYGTSHVLGVTVGNEFVFNATNFGTTADAATTRLISKITEVRTDLTGLGYNLQVGTSETGGTTTQVIVDASDYVFSNVHPWFSDNTAETAATFANTVYTSQLSPLVTASTRSPPPVIFQGEFGWPSTSDVAGDVNQANSAASITNLQRVLDDWVCSAARAATPYFWFSAFDEPWKAASGLGVEAHWGLFDKDGNLKDITIPNCNAAMFIP